MSNNSDNSEKMREVIIESARVQVAGLNAGIEFWKSWLNHASEFSQNVNTQLLEATKSGANQDAVIGKITDSSRKFIRDISSLPGIYSKHFEKELSKTPGGAKKGKSKRQAKAKN